MDLISWTKKQMALVIRQASTQGQSVASPTQQQTNIPALSPLTAEPAATAAHAHASTPPPTVTEMINGNYETPQGTIVGRVVNFEQEQPAINKWNITLADGRKFNVDGIVPKNISTALVPTHVRLQHNRIEFGFLSKDFREAAGEILHALEDNRSADPSTTSPLAGVMLTTLQAEHGGQGR